MLKDKVIVITGGAGLIGQEFVKAVVEQQGTAVIADINEENGIQVQQHLCQELGTADIDFVCLDITSAESISRMIDTLNTRYGRIDSLVNNAYPRNKNYGRHFFDVEYADFCENLNLNLGGYFLTSQRLAGYFQKQGHGNIINISSIYGVIAPKFEVYDNTPMTMPVEYAAIKSAIIHLTKYMAKYFKGMNIRVNTLSPGGILDKQPVAFLEAYRKQCLNKGMLDKSDMRGTLVYLLSDLSEYVNGQNIVVDDGFSV
ncbi:MAG: flagellin modification protein A [Gammaproteobacteria bacterium]|nr:flagellin modification protein A [Gammaproteobacteria bacterium]